MANKIILITLIPARFNEGGAEQTGINMHSHHISSDMALPIRGAVDFEIHNTGTTNAYLFGTAIKIPPNTTWSPQKSTPFPYYEQPKLTFDGNYNNTRQVEHISSLDMNGPTGSA